MLLIKGRPEFFIDFHWVATEFCDKAYKEMYLKQRFLTKKGKLHHRIIKKIVSSPIENKNGYLTKQSFFGKDVELYAELDKLLEKCNKE